MALRYIGWALLVAGICFLVWFVVDFVIVLAHMPRLRPDWVRLNGASIVLHYFSRSHHDVMTICEVPLWTCMVGLASCITGIVIRVFYA